MENETKAYSYLQYARVEDVYNSSMNIEEVIETYFPDSLPAFVQDMSDITVAFYGTMLAKARLFWGASGVNPLATSTITETGRFKARQAMVRYPGLPKDGRGLLLIVIAEIFFASPEYQFRILEFSERFIKPQIMENDRYYRIAVNKKVEQLITWPTILHFLRGANAELGWPYTIDMDVKQLEPDGACLYKFSIQKQYNDDNKQPAIPGFLQMEDAEQINASSLLSHIPLGNLGQYAGPGFAALLRKAKYLEAHNYARQKKEGRMMYMQAESMYAKKCGNMNNTKEGYAVIKSRTQAGRKNHVIVGIMNQHHTEDYHFTFDYYLWKKSVYEDKFNFLTTEAEQDTRKIHIPVQSPGF